MPDYRELVTVTALSLFSGIGGLDLAAEAAGIRTVTMCEIDPFCRSVLEKRWPAMLIYEDITTLRGDEVGGAVDVVYGGFPCQDLSVSGERKGLDGERSGLWYAMLRIVRSLRPRWMVAENVRGAVDLALDTVVGGLEEADYKVWPLVISASAFGAPHIRERLFVVAARQDVADSCATGLQGGELDRAFCEVRASSSWAASERGVAGGMWPTPTVCGNHNRAGVSAKSGNGLATEVRLWTTPQAADCKVPPVGASTEACDTDARTWATPKASDSGAGMTARTSGCPIEKSTHLQCQVSVEEKRVAGYLNPDWEECLMGIPIGWTDPYCDTPSPWPGWPAPRGFFQFDFEPPRLTLNTRHRSDRVKAMGNAVVPQQAYPIFRAIVEIERCRTRSGGGDHLSAYQP